MTVRGRTAELGRAAVKAVFATGPQRGVMTEPLARVRNWLEEDGYHVTAEVAVDHAVLIVPFCPNPDDRSQWRPEVRIGRDPRRRRVVVSLQASLVDDHHALLNSDSLAAGSARKQIRRHLFLQGLGMSFLGEGGVDSLLVDDVLYDDALTKDLLMRTLRQVYGAMLFIEDVLTAACHPSVDLDV